MAFRLASLVVSGEICNLNHYSTTGYLELTGAEHAIHLQLTGNCGTSLAGKHIRFTARPELQTFDHEELPQSFADLGWVAHQQVGPTGTMELRTVKTFDCSSAEFSRRYELGELPPAVIRPSLYLEWYSQNGRVLVELIDPLIEIVEERPIRSPRSGAHLETDLEADDLFQEVSDVSRQPGEDEGIDEIPPENRATGLGITILGFDEHDRPTVEERSYPPPSDVFEDIPVPWPPELDELERQFDRNAAAIDDAITSGRDSAGDSDDMRELKLMDELLERRTGDLLWDMVNDVEILPPPAGLDENAAEEPLKTLLAQLALYGISIHVCNHFTPYETYRWLMEEILPEEIGNRELRFTQWVQCFDTGESSCPACEAEFDREWNQRHPPDESRRHDGL